MYKRQLLQRADIRQFIAEEVRKSSPALLRVINQVLDLKLDERAALKIVDVALKKVSEVRHDREHELRSRFDGFVRRFIERLKTDPATREIAEKHPWVVLNLLKAFDKAAAIADAQRMEHADYHVASGAISQEAAKALRQPVLRHGIKANRLILETAAQYSLEQGLTPRLMRLDELFAKSAMDQ